MNAESVAHTELRYTRVPKVAHLIRAGVPTEVIPTYLVLSDHANNKTGLCYPRMDTMARLIKRSARTIQRHLHLLKDLGLIEFVERRRTKGGKFQSWRYRVLHFALLTTGHGKARGSNRQTRRKNNAPQPPREERLKREATRRREQIEEVFGPDAV